VTDELRVLWSLHELDERLVSLQEALRRYPGQRSALDERLTAERRRLEVARQQITDLQLKHRQVEKDIEALTAEERKFMSQLPLVKKNEEYTALLHEIQGAKAKRSDRETELLLMMEDEQKLQGERPALERSVADLEAETKQRLERIEVEEKAERDQVAGVERERSDLLAKLPATTRSRYERIRSSREGRAVVPILKGACGGCYRGQPPQALQEARRGDRVLICDGCGRMLMLPPETANA
jgi:predicted  nucleic acid-binding Zn-ribbon protein